MIKPRPGRQIQGISIPHPQFNQLPRHHFRPATIGRRAGRTGMQNPADMNLRVFTNQPPAFRREPANPDQPLRLQNFQHPAQMRVADVKQAVARGQGQLVRREIAPAGFAECQRTIIRHEMIGEKFLRRAEAFGEESPEPPAADFRAGTIETEHRPFGMLHRRPADGRGDYQPITDGGNLAKGHTGLRHAERPGIHAEKNNSFFAAAEFPQIQFMRRPGVSERIVDVRDGRFELQAIHLRRQFLRGGDELLADGIRFQAIKSSWLPSCGQETRKLDFGQAQSGAG